MSTTGDGVSKLKLSDPKGDAAMGNAALSVPTIEDQIAEREQLADSKKRIQQLERDNAELEKVLDKRDKQAKQAKASGLGKARHMAHAEGWQAICTAPDFCRVGKDIVAFNSFATLDHKQTASLNVKARGTSVYRQGDVIKNVQGDAGAHIVSGTALGSGHVKILDGHENVKVNGVPVGRHDSRCLINCDASGVGGAQGKVVTEQKTVGSDAAPQPIPTAPVGARTSGRLEALQKARARTAEALIDFDATDEYVNFEQSNQVIDGLIGQISNAPGTTADYAAQAMRGLLGFSKDVVMGIGELAYEGVKAVPKLVQLSNTQKGQLHAQLDAQIIVENIKLGNISAESVGKGALNIGQAIIKPVVDPWSKGQYVESVTRGVTEAGGAALGWLKWFKGARARDLAQAARMTVGPDVASGATTLVSATSLRPSLTGNAKLHSGVHIAKANKPEFSGDWKNYVTHGLVEDPLKSAEGRRMVVEFEKQGLSRADAMFETKNLMKTGSSLALPNPVEVGDKFYKVITDGSKVGPNSAFWATKAEMDSLKGMTYDQISGKLGLPLASQQGVRYQVMEITALRPGTEFTSVIAATSEIGKNGAIWTQGGEGIQSLILDRSIFTEPVLTKITFP